jgi:hypothetical protein
MCSNICESNFEKVYDKFDDFFEFVIHELNSLLTNENSELKLIMNTSSHFILKKLSINLIKLSHQHARLDANYYVLIKLLSNEENEFIHLFKQESDYKKGMNYYMFIFALIFFFINGYFIEYIRIKMRKQ